MNSQERRLLRRERAKTEETRAETRIVDIRKAALPAPRHHQPESKSALLGFFATTKLVIGGAATIATLLGLWAFWPDVVIEPYISRDPQNPLAQQFYVQNINYYNLYNLSPYCVDIDIRSDFNDLHGNVFQNRSVSKLERSAKTNIVCELPTIGNRYSVLPIGIAVKYQLPFGIPRCKMARFNGISLVDGGYAWTYAGTSGCGSTLDKMNTVINGGRQITR